MFMKTDFQLLQLKFHSCNFKQAFYFINIHKYRVTSTTQKYFYTSFSFGTWLSNLHV